MQFSADLTADEHRANALDESGAREFSIDVDSRTVDENEIRHLATSSRWALAP
ncbi:MAG: hypothetical protein IIB75_03105 [Proteobacteria bacterium]|nr:hypothetical protein [Pseudomonadota bacterium]